MKTADQYHSYVAWSDEDEVYIGYCPDLFIGGVCHGNDPVAVYAELREIVEEEIDDCVAAGRTLPPVRTQPLSSAQADSEVSAAASSTA